MRKLLLSIAALVATVAIYAQVTSVPAASGGPGTSYGNLTQNADGTITAAKAITSGSATTSASACDWALSNVCIITATGDTTVTFTHPHGSGPYWLLLNNDASARVWTLPAAALQGCTPTVASSGTIQMFAYDGTNYQGAACGSNETASIIRGTERAAPAAPASTFGAAWFDSTSHVWSAINPSGVISTTKQVATVALGASDTLNCTSVTTEQAFATLATIPANYLTASTGGRIEFGSSVTTGATPPTLLFKARLGSGTSGTLIYSQPTTNAIGASYAGQNMAGELLFQGTTAAGSSANVFTTPLATFVQLGSQQRNLQAQPVAWNTTLNNAIQLTMTCNSTGSGSTGAAVTLDYIRWVPYQ